MIEDGNFSISNGFVIKQPHSNISRIQSHETLRAKPEAKISKNPHMISGREFEDILEGNVHYIPTYSCLLVG
jgi:hypothetical protein